MNYRQIIDDLSKKKYIRDTCNIAGCLADDLFQHVWLMILEMKEDKIIEIHSKGYIQFYIYRIIINEAKNPKNKFLRQINIRNAEPIEDFELCDNTDEYNKDIDKLIDSVNNELDKMYFYDEKLFRLYVKHGSLRKVQAATGIKYGSIYQTITKVKKAINESINSRG